MTIERVMIERVRENPMFPEPKIVYALTEQASGTPEITQMPPDFTVPFPVTEPPRQEVIETTATVIETAETVPPLEPEAPPPRAIPVPVGTPERASPETPPRERDAEPPHKSQSDATPSRPGSPATTATNGKSTPENTTTNPEKPSVLTRLDFYKAQIEKRDAPSKEQSRRTEKGAANPLKGKGRAASGQVPKPKAPVKAAKIPKAPVR